MNKNGPGPANTCEPVGVGHDPLIPRVVDDLYGIRSILDDACASAHELRTRIFGAVPVGHDAAGVEPTPAGAAAALHSAVRALREAALAMREHANFLNNTVA